METEKYNNLKNKINSLKFYYQMQINKINEDNDNLKEFLNYTMHFQMMIHILEVVVDDLKEQDIIKKNIPVSTTCDAFFELSLVHSKLKEFAEENLHVFLTGNVNCITIINDKAKKLGVNPKHFNLDILGNK